MLQKSHLITTGILISSLTGLNFCYGQSAYPTTTIIPSTTLYLPSYTLISPLPSTTPTSPSTTTTTTTPPTTTTNDPVITTPPRETIPTPVIIDTPTPIPSAPSTGTTTIPPTSTNTPVEPPKDPVIPRNNTPVPPRPVPEPTPQECPPLEPLSPTPQECPKQEKVPVIPKMPAPIVYMPFLGAGLFWLIFFLLNKQQINSQNRIAKFSLTQSQKQNINSAKDQAYQDLLNYLSTSSTSTQNDKYQEISAKIDLMGSPRIRQLNSDIGSALNNKDPKQVQKLMRDLVKLIKIDQE